RVGILGIETHAASRVDNVAAVPAALVFEYCHQRGAAARFEGAAHWRKLHRQKGVAVQYEERPVEHPLIERQTQRAAGSTKLGPLVDVAQRAHRRGLGG